MASYTMTLKELIEFQTVGNAYSTKDRIEEGRKKLFDFDYPIFDKDYKSVFETHFIRKFFMREIGFETEGLFKFHLETWLLINMPYFNKLFESELIYFDPLTNTKVNETSNKKGNRKQADNRNSSQTSETDGTSKGSNLQNSNGSSVDDNFERQLESNNPDSRLSITSNDGEGVIEYASNIKENNENNQRTTSGHVEGSTEDTTNVKNTSSVNDEITSTIDTTEDYLTSKFGKIGSQSFSRMMNEYRDSLLRIENQIFNEMQDLFMLVY